MAEKHTGVLSPIGDALLLAAKKLRIFWRGATLGLGGYNLPLGLSGLRRQVVALVAAGVGGAEDPDVVEGLLHSIDLAAALAEEVEGLRGAGASLDEVLRAVEVGSGRQFDPEVARAFLDLVARDEIELEG